MILPLMMERMMRCLLHSQGTLSIPKGLNCMEGLFSLEKAMAGISREPMAQRRYNGFYENALFQIGLLAEMIRSVKADTTTFEPQTMFFDRADKPLETEQNKIGIRLFTRPGGGRRRDPPSLLVPTAIFPKSGWPRRRRGTGRHRISTGSRRKPGVSS